jgi:hypothetical protein
MSTWLTGVTRTKQFFLAVIAIGVSSALIGCSTVAVYFAQQETNIALEADCTFKKQSPTSDKYQWNCAKRADEKDRAFTLEALREERCSIDSESGKKCNTSFNGVQTHNWEPPPTAVPVPASVDVRYVIGGKGLGLSCSIPPLAQKLFIDPLRPKSRSNGAPTISPVALQYAQACTTHDYCYRHGLATYGYAQQDCDDMLFDQAYRICAHIYAGEASISNCQQQAALVRMGVRFFGKTAYQELGESTYFEFDPMARGTRKSFSASRLLPDSKSGAKVLKTYFLDRNKYSAMTGRNTNLSAVIDETKQEVAVVYAPPVMTLNPSEKDLPYRLWISSRAALSNTGFEFRGLDDKDKASTKPAKLDCNSPNAWVTSNGSYGRVITFGPTATPKPPLKECYASIKLATRDELPVWSIRGHDTINQNVYRLYDQAPLSGSFSKGSDEYLFIARGYYGDGSGNSSSGENYEKSVSFVALDAGAQATTSTTKFQLVDMHQDDAPLSVFRARISDDVLGKDIVVSVSAQKPDNRICVKSWQKTDGKWQAQTCSMLSNELVDATWMQMPVQVMRTPEGHDSLVFTRVCLQPHASCSVNFSQLWNEVAKGQFDPKFVFLSSQTWRLQDGTWKQVMATSEQQVGLLPLTQALIAGDTTTVEREVFLKSRIAQTPQSASNVLTHIRACKDASANSPECTKARQLAALMWYHSQAIAAASPSSSKPAAITAYFVPHPLPQFYEEVSLK